ncbi:MAG: hypothetical protein ABIO69_04850 [Sphingomicrobium sp.]
MAARTLAICALMLCSTSAEASKPFDMHGLIVGKEGARYVKGVPTLDLQQQRGAIQLRSMGFHNNRPMFAIAFYNAGPEPVNIGLEDIHASSDGAPLRVFSVEELQRQAKQKAWWTQFGLAMVGGLGAGLAASQRNTYRSTITSPYGSYTVHSSYPSLAGQFRANAIAADTAFGVAAIQYQLDATLELLDSHVVQRTTIDPGSTYAGLIVLDKLKKGDPPFELRLDVDWNGERYPFAYVVQKPGRPVPAQYAATLAENSKPKAWSARFMVAGSEAGGSASGAARQKMANGAVFLRSGAVKIPAKTQSGYCLRAPDEYRGTGSKDYPVINAGLPRCGEDGG